MRGRISREAEQLRKSFIDWALTMETNECVLWPFGKQTDGYGAFRGKIVSRIVRELAYGPPPTAKHEAAHSCQQSRACINKRHLRWDTHKGNQRDKIAHATSMRGELAPRAKLTKEDVLKIREEDGKIPRQVLADRYGGDRSTICVIANRKSWSWL